MGWQRRREEALELLARVGLEEPDRLYSAYPHELSGGQQQRVTIAQAIACRPALVVADEPTSALDSTTRSELVSLFKDLKERMGLALLLVSHDIGTLAALADRLLVFYAGRVVEEGPLGRVCRDPLHPYTRALLASLPQPRAGRETEVAVHRWRPAGHGPLAGRVRVRAALPGPDGDLPHAAAR